MFAPVMGVGGAGWLERSEREQEEAPSKAIEALELKPGMVVADIGAGSGYYTSRIVEARGTHRPRLRHRHSAGHDRAAQPPHHSEGLTNVTTILGGDGRSEAAAGERSIWRSWWTSITSCSSRRCSCSGCKEAFKPGGRLVLLEFRKEDPTVPILEVHKMSVAEVKAGARGGRVRARQGDRRPALATHHRAARER